MGSKFDILIGKWLSGNITGDERKELMEWAEVPANRKVLEEAQQMWKVSGSLKYNEKANADAAWQEFKQLATKKHSKSIVHRSLPFAAALALLLCLGFLLNYFMMNEKVNPAPIAATSFHTDTIADTTLSADEPYVIMPPVLEAEKTATKRKRELIAVNAGDSALIYILPDNSKVYLNKNSKLMFSENFVKSNRTVYLSGEAFFEVTKNKGEFIVICQDTRTRVLGTSFNVKGYQPNNQVEVTVITGLVEVTNTKGNNVGKQLLLKPGEQAVFNAKTDQALRSKSVKKDKWWKRNNFRTKIKQFINRITNKNNNN